MTRRRTAGEPRRLGRAGAVVAACLVVTAAALAPTQAEGPPPPRPTGQTLSFDRAPGGWWQYFSSTGEAAPPLAHGFLTLDVPADAYAEYLLYAPHGVWNSQAHNARGWVVEASLQVGAGDTGTCADDGGVELWMHDDRELVKVAVAADGVCLNYPDFELAPVDTSTPHTYRVEARGRLVRVYVDGVQVLDHTLSVRGDGTRALAFGDGNGASPASASRWDYVRYETRPGFDPVDWPGSAWPAGTSSAPAQRLAAPTS